MKIMTLNRMKRVVFTSATTIIIQALCINPSNSTLLYSITDLGALDEVFDGVTSSRPSKINNDGLVTGTSLGQTWDRFSCGDDGR